jgi:hypothetical protein
MSSEQNLQGAAEKISGLLNPQDQQETEIKKVEPSESEPEEQEVQESQAESEATNEQESENTEVTEEQQTELEEPNLHRLKVNGQEIEVSLDELKAGYSRDSDYRQKTHSLSQERKSLEEQKNSLRQSYETRLKELNDTIATADEFIRQQQGGQDLQKLFDEDPVAAARLEFQLRQQSEKIEDMKSKARAAQQKQYNDFLETQKELAAQRIPEFADPNKADTFKLNMRNTLRDYGFNDQEIGTLADHRFLMVAKDAMNYKSLQNKKPIVQKKIANAPKVIKSGVAKQNVSSGREVIRNKINKLRKSGSMNDAKSALLDIINLKSQQRK